jgi:type VI secretion system secreted protein VgrG
MPAHTQANRPMRVETDLGTDVLLFDSFSGVERISEPFAFRLELLSEDRDIDPDAVLRKPVTLAIDLENGETRHVHGLVSRFALGDRVHVGEGDDLDYLTSYTAEMVPWLWFLSLSRDCRIFQEKTVLEIVEEVFTEGGWSDFEIRCTLDYPARDYCVQYRETDLDFVSRLLEEEGIFYFFEHTDSKHTLVLADDNGAIKACPHKEEAVLRPQPVHDEDVVTGLRCERAVHAGKVTLRDYDYLHPNGNLEVELPGTEEQEVYDYHPGRFTSPEDGERYARIQLEALEAQRELVHGEGNCRAFQTGFWFKLEEHYSSRLNRNYTLVEIAHSGRGGSYHSRDGDTEPDYRNRFSAIPYDLPYRPPRRHAKPVLQGSQTAMVTGPAGEEIWTDKYGRVKVQFHWDRKGSRNENSSCWIRVATPWGSKGFGSVTIPRIGDEVVVDFLEGDSDRPLVVGSLYNAERMPPYELPAQQTQAGMRSHSIKGGTGNYSEIRFDDTPGEEKLVIHAEKDHHVVVENNEYHTVEGAVVMDFGGVKIRAGKVAIAGGQREEKGDQEYGYGVYDVVADEYIGRYGKVSLWYGEEGDYTAEYNRRSGKYTATYHRNYEATYGTPPKLSYQPGDSARVIPRSKRSRTGPRHHYKATYNSDYDATYNGDYKAQYKGNYTATYKNYRAAYGAYTAVYGPYTAAYAMYTAVCPIYNAAYGTYLAAYGVYQPVYGAKFETVYGTDLKTSVFTVINSALQKIG